MLTSRLIGAVGIVAVVGGVLAAQTPASPAFEVVSITRNTSNPRGDSVSGIVNQRPDGAFTMVHAPITLLIARAYPPTIPAEMVGLPSWTRSELYDVKTTSSIPNPTQDQRRAMLRAMLADRFRLVAHVERREQSAYDLVLARDDRRLGPGLKAVDTDCERITAERAATPPPASTPPPDFSVPPPPCTFRIAGAPIRDSVGDKQGRLGDLFEGEGTMESLAQGLRPWAGRIVVNKTALPGSYHVMMNFEMSAGRGPNVVSIPDAPPSIFEAVQEQLGLKLEYTTGSADMLIIDHVERPTEDTVFTAARPVAQSSLAHTAACNAPAKDPTSTIKLSGAPFSAVPTADGCTIFVSLSGPGGHIGVFRRAGGEVTLIHDIPIAFAPAGMAMSHDGKLLAVAAGAHVLLFDVDQLRAGDDTPLASASDGPNAGSVYAAITADDRLLFISDESTATLTVYDLVTLRSRATGPVGHIPVGRAPVGLVQSPDGRLLYSTSELAPSGSDAPATCKAEGGGGGTTPQGVVSVIDVARAARDPVNAVVASVAGGCDPVRIALSARGDRAYVTARGENGLLVFDTAKLRSDPAHARLATVPVGPSPVGVLVAGDHIITADSNRFAANSRQEWLSLVDAGKVGQGAAAVIGHVPTGAFPRELRLTTDRKTLLVTNFLSGTLELIDLARLTPAYFSEQQQAKTADDARRR